MLTKKTTPTISSDSSGKITKMIIEYRLFGLLIYRKELFTPFYYGVKEYDGFTTRF
ncbi:MAG: hypothetical protein AB9922_07335 [Bacteroidales bacterium]